MEWQEYLHIVQQYLIPGLAIIKSLIDGNKKEIEITISHRFDGIGDHRTNRNRNSSWSNFITDIKSLANVVRQGLQKKQPMKECRICGKELNPQRPSKKCDSCRKRTSRYNITEEELKQFLTDPSCETCGTKLDSRSMRIDHCHETGEVRGILCNGCNLILGYAKDDPEILFNLIKYVTI